ncbi:MAG: ComEA family DNA-binding protein [Bacteroidia bacterium]
MIFCFTKNAKAQQKFRQIPQTLISEIIERYIENSEEALDFTDLQEQLEYRLANPYNLNRADALQLQSLFFLTEIDIKVIIKHRVDYGNFISLFELQAVDGLSIEAIRWLPYFVTVKEQDKKPLSVNDFKNSVNDLFFLTETDIQNRRGYTDRATTPYLGNKLRHLVRLRSHINNRFYYGITMEKDMGEPFASNGIALFEFNSAHIFYKGYGKIKYLALGDYQANFGQGLVMGSGIAPRKSALSMQVRRNFEMLRPYRSANQVGFLRGAAVTLQNKNWLFTPFFSYKPISTTAITDTSDNFIAFSSEDLGGLFRTPNELNKRNNNTQTLAGANITYQNSTHQLGFTYVATHFNVPATVGSRLYQQFNFSGNNAQNAGVNYTGSIGNISVFSELGFSSNKNSFASIAGATVPLHKKLDLLFLYRNYNKSYYAPYTNAFGEFTGTSNETGIYSAILFKPTNKWTINTYFDLFESKWLRYLVNAPSNGIDFLTDWQYTPTRNSLLYFRYRFERKKRNAVAEESFFRINDRNRQMIRFHAQSAISKQLVLKTRIEKSFFAETNQKSFSEGLLFFIDGTLKTENYKWQLSNRLAWFDIGSYDARIYAVESDVLYQFAIPMFQNQGWRYYAVLNYQPSKKLEFWVKYGQWVYANINRISSGNEQIDGNTLQEIRFQMMVRF